MRNVKSGLTLAILLCAGAAQAEPSGGPRLGTSVSESEIRPFAITVMPDGRNLPDGSGTVEMGRSLYRDRCAWCHGPGGKEGPAARLVGEDGFFNWYDPLRPLRIARYPILLFSVGGQWAYSTSIFDYIRRAMPHHSPGSLTNDEVYAATAWILYQNGLIGSQEVMHRRTLPVVCMPGRQRTLSAWQE